MGLLHHLGNTVCMFQDNNGDNLWTKSFPAVLLSFGEVGRGRTQQSTPTIRYQYNGKEKIDELGLGWNDYGARNYDALLGRWMGVDALAEKYMGYNPYVYVADNPIGLIDPDGMQIETCPTCPNTPDYDEARNSKSVFTYHKEEGILTNGDAEVEVKGSRTSEKFETKIETNPGKEILASATLVLSYDLNIPEGTDIVPQKWIGYAAVFVAGVAVYVGYELTMAKDKDDHMKGGKKGDRDRGYGKEKEFWDWWHKTQKPKGKGRSRDVGDDDIEDIYKDWEEKGKPSVKNNNKNYQMELLELKKFIIDNEYITVEEFFINLRKKDNKKFKVLINLTKIIFINTDDSNIIDAIAMLYHEFKIHSAVPIIVSKLITYDKFSGGTMAYSLKGLRLEGFTTEIRNLLDLDISFEMRCMINRLGIES